ncbi:MAG: hypothetical protein JO363_00765 [Solirubrobacterales bacterium]|nr:hypothetical protein [Solirubrobacterales bacterium]
MDSLPVALSVHHFVSSVGADAGFAAFVAVAILVLLYFAHARETATLRTRADEAAARVDDLEAQVAQLTDQVAALPAEISVRAASPRAAAAYGAFPDVRWSACPRPPERGPGRSRPRPPPAWRRRRWRRQPV